MQNESYHAAIPLLKQALGTFPRDVDLWDYLGLAYSGYVGFQTSAHRHVPRSADESELSVETLGEAIEIGSIFVVFLSIFSSILFRGHTATSFSTRRHVPDVRHEE